MLDRLSGEFIQGDKFIKRMTWATGLDAKGQPIEAAGARYKDGPVTVSPSPAGAANWQTMSFSPITKLAYLPGQEGSFTFNPVDPATWEYTPGGLNTGIVGFNGPFGRFRRHDRAAGEQSPHEPQGAEDQPKAAGGFLVAWDPAANKERWRVNNAGGLGGGGTIVTAGNVVFHGSTAYHAATGQKLWEASLGGTLCNPISYELDGKQYIAILARANPNNRLFAFALDGKEPMPGDFSLTRFRRDFDILARQVTGRKMRRKLVLALAATVTAALAQEPPAPIGPSTAIQRRAAPPARITKFAAQPETIQPGGSVTLVWATENPNSVAIEPGLGTVRARGSRVLTPGATTTYSITVNGPNNTTVTKSVTVTVAGTTPAAATAETAKREIRRMPDGHPDLSGVYNSAIGRGAATGDAPVLKPDAAKFKVVRGPTDTGLYADCMPTGVPGAFFVPYQWQIVEGADRLVIMYEYPHLFRVIPTNGGAHQVDLDPTWMGDSIGHWEGDTLVVDTIGFNDKTELPGGFRHTEALHVVERFQRANFETMEYQATIEDPNVFEKPWTIVRSFPLRTDLDKVDEFVCENNKDYKSLFGK